MKRKLLVFLLALTMVVSFAAPASAKTKESNWDKKKYGDTIDIGPKLREMSKDEEVQKEILESLKKDIKKMAPLQQSKNLTNAESPIGTQKSYAVLDTMKNTMGLKTFTLRSVGQHCEVWVADNLAYPAGDSRPTPAVTNTQADRLRDTFDNVVYKTDTDFFGIPDSLYGENGALPGLIGAPQDYYSPIDGVERTIILVDNIRDESYYDPSYPFYVVGFYFGTYEAYYDRNIITIDADKWETRLEGTILPTLAHEFQHLIHDDNDSDEETWINEGMADFAEYLCGFGQPEGHINYFLDHPETSLTKWDDYAGTSYGSEVLADYGQAYLLQLYMDEHFGKEFIRSLAKDKDNGITSVNKILDEYNTGMDFAELFRRFTLALTIDSSNIQNTIKGSKNDATYKFNSIDLKINYPSAEQFNKPGVPAWGADYIQLKDAKNITNIIFDGISFLPVQWKAVADPKNSGSTVLWGNRGDEVNNFLIFEADLEDEDSATLKFDTMYNIEEEWDYGMVQVSTDEGKTWTSLSNSHTRSDLDPNGYPAIRDNLPGFTGSCPNWTTETFDLSDYAGEKILIGFRYMTDWASNEAGWYIKNIEIPEIGYSNDCSDTDGFMSIQEVLGQYVNYAISFVNEIPLGRDGANNVYTIKTYYPLEFDEGDVLEIKKLFTTGNNYMIIWYAASEGATSPADYDCQIIYRANKKKTKR